MNTKKFFWSILFLSIISVFSIGMIACGDDDEDNGILSGTWSGVVEREMITLKFGSNGSGVWTRTSNSDWYGPETETGKFTYQLINDTTGIAYVNRSSSYYGNYTAILYLVISENSIDIFEGGFYDDYFMTLYKGGSSGIGGK